MQRWEYKTLLVANGEVPQATEPNDDGAFAGYKGSLTELLKRYGEQGWELAAAISGAVLIFKRPAAK